MNADLDIERPGELLAYLREQGRIAPDEVPQFHVLGGGVSNRAVLTERPNGEAWVVKQALAKLRVPTDWFSSPKRIEREALGLRWLVKLAPPGTTVPLIFEDDENYILAMAAVPQPHDNWKTLLLAGQLDTDHVAQFGALLGTIHRNAAGDPSGRTRFRRSLVLRLVAPRPLLSLHGDPGTGGRAVHRRAARGNLGDTANPRPRRL